MSKKKTHRTAMPCTVAEVLTMVDQLDDQFPDNGTAPDASEYQRLYSEALAHECVRLERKIVDSGNGAVILRVMLEELEWFYAVEDAIRRAGFVQGYAYGRRLTTTQELHGPRSRTDGTP